MNRQRSEPGKATWRSAGSFVCRQCGQVTWRGDLCRECLAERRMQRQIAANRNRIQSYVSIKVDMNSVTFLALAEPLS